MLPSFESLYADAVSLLHQLATTQGILASTIKADNYKRIWARDSMVCGVAGLWIKDKTVISGLKISLLTLANNQHAAGMIPSNVMPDSTDPSYGSLMGRIDATTWFIVGAGLYYQTTNDQKTWEQLLPAIEKARVFLKSAEINGGGWIYTPISGNWADEYPIHGYTLYDNMLRIWGEQLYAKITLNETKWLNDIKKKNLVNFWPAQNTSKELQYHKDAYSRIPFDKIQHFIAFILPGNFDTRFDAAGNALALLHYSISEVQKEKLSSFIEALTTSISKPLIPAFWPIITKDSFDYKLLKGNYSFDFKNEEGAFHNGGIWPVWMGLFCLGLAKNGMHDEVESIINAFVETVNQDEQWQFQEYIHAKTLNLGGKTQMGYTAAGIVFMKLALEQFKT